MPNVFDNIRDFLFRDEDEGEDDFELPLDESGKLIRPIGKVRRVKHSFRTHSTGQHPSNPQPTSLFDVLPLDDEARALLMIAKAVREQAYAKYSQFHVGAALAATSGKVYAGVNIENASYPAGICAERSAFAAAITAGEREFSALAIVGGDPDIPCYPCGICRQFIAEFCPADFPVILSDGIYALGGLLPHGFEL